ncbi:MAG TPA: response regulator transcription factor [Umezawaea sp.]|nr:response regulator transcription factor [Umezawaea sp.]
MPRSVLVVDDDSSFRELAIGLLRSWGHDVVGEAGSVAEAVERVTELRPDTVLIDIGLPDGDGFQLIARMRLMSWRPRVLLISSDSSAATDSEARQAGAVGFVPKTDMAGSQFRRMLDG